MKHLFAFLGYIFGASFTMFGHISYKKSLKLQKKKKKKINAFSPEKILAIHASKKTVHVLPIAHLV